MAASAAAPGSSTHTTSAPSGATIHFVFCSTLELCRQLVDLLDDVVERRNRVDLDAGLVRARDDDLRAEFLEKLLTKACRDREATLAVNRQQMRSRKHSPCPHQAPC